MSLDLEGKGYIFLVAGPIVPLMAFGTGWMTFRGVGIGRLIAGVFTVCAPAVMPPPPGNRSASGGGAAGTIRGEGLGFGVGKRSP